MDKHLDGTKNTEYNTAKQNRWERGEQLYTYR